MSESGDEAARKAVEDRCTTIARVFARTILKLTEGEWAELQACSSNQPALSAAARKARMRMYSMYVDTDELKSYFEGNADLLQQFRAALANFCPDWKAFWTAYQSLFGGIVDNEVAFLAGIKADALQCLLDLMFVWSSPVRIGEAGVLQGYWDDIATIAHANK
jgi:hypothetical protein